MSRRRKAFLVLVTAGIVVFSLELGSFLLLSLAEQRWVGYREVARAQRRAEAAADRKGTLARENLPLPATVRGYVTHPYLGFVLDENYDREARFRRDGADGLDFGFFLTQPRLVHLPSSDSLVVALTGGSVACALALAEKPTLRAQIGRAVPGKQRVQIVNLSLPGYKQPQQLISVAYALALGARFDVLINLDGFNDVVLPFVDNAVMGVSPIYPRGWYYRAKMFDRAVGLAAGEIAYLEKRRAALARIFSTRPLRCSLTLGLIWTVIDRSLANTLAERERDLAATSRGADESYQVRGPRPRGADEVSNRRELVDLWFRCSLQMDGLARANGAPYVHFLQPNQYVPGSKPMGEEERHRAIDEASRFVAPVRMGYPLLQEAGERLREAGVRFVDLTPVFATVELPVYEDAACHLNPRGNDILGAAMAREVAAALEARPGGPRRGD